MERTAMPEAGIDKNQEPSLGEGEIWFPANCDIFAISNPGLPEGTSQAALDIGVLLSHAGHDSAADGRAHVVHRLGTAPFGG